MILFAESEEGGNDEEADRRAMSAIAQALVAANNSLQGAHTSCPAGGDQCLQLITPAVRHTSTIWDIILTSKHKTAAHKGMRKEMTTLLRVIKEKLVVDLSFPLA